MEIFAILPAESQISEGTVLSSTGTRTSANYLLDSVRSFCWFWLGYRNNYRSYNTAHPVIWRYHSSRETNWMPTESNEVKPHTESNSGKTKQTKFVFLCFSPHPLRGGDMNSAGLFSPGLGFVRSVTWAANSPEEPELRITLLPEYLRERWFLR